MRKTGAEQGCLGRTGRGTEGAESVRVAKLHPSEPHAGRHRPAATLGRQPHGSQTPDTNGATRSKYATVARIARSGLCTGCGTCAGVCPREALSMVVDRRKGQYVPRIDRRKCQRCGVCVDVCPGVGLDFEHLNESLFGEIPDDLALGKYLGTYIGHALDRKTRHDGASGGLVTALLVCALEEGLIDGALVTRMRPDKPLEPEPFIARTKEDIIAAARSKYCPVPANVAVKALLDEEGRFAVVGLPCHIQGIRLAEQRFDGLKERIRYRVSLACSLNHSFRGTERILKGLGISPQSVRILEYRGRGWPGSMLIRTDDGTDTIVPLADYDSQLEPYSLGRCTLCSDMFGELSDLSCGDAWVRDAMRHDKSGSSFALTRTAEAEEWLERAASQEVVHLSELNPRELLGSQRHVTFKKGQLQSRMRLMRLAGRRVPHYHQRLSEPVEGDFLDALSFYAARYALSSGNGFLRGLFHVTSSLARRKEQKPRIARAGRARQP